VSEVLGHRVAHRSALPSTLGQDEAAYSRIPIQMRAFLEKAERVRVMPTAQTLETRTREVIDFISGVLFTANSPIRGWLGADLLNVFDAEVSQRYV
jgi:hypothetical protein